MARIGLVYGGASFGEPNTEARISDLGECQRHVDVFSSYGHSEYDTSNRYANGTSEPYFAKLDLKGGRVSTKAFPFSPGSHSPENLRKAVLKSAADLQPHKIKTLYLHMPDRSVPYEDTLRGVDALYKEGHFEEFGLSNFPAWEVAEICTLCDKNGWVKPAVYQGRYNALQRDVESELFPCLRKFGMRFYAYSPLAGGLLAGNIRAVDDFDKRTGSRWDPAAVPMFAGILRAAATPLLPVLAELGPALEAHNIGLAEAAMRWLQHHSKLADGDKVVIGASKLDYLVNALQDSEKGPLPEEVLRIIDDAGNRARGFITFYAF
ncbi:NADP-dependent oxidoreductase domain-containing protein [Schizophyllum amplum]|uniref:NADP-dependent oxidoreductase domain-containing protein n=1 Tax=Schizophyllum amplum TaxID=97359 RepID=A0A550C1J1_9AGAR|nr:NADP-dependent oxidoreductase domain-containing protein [Auriculariopsis ampla]